MDLFAVVAMCISAGHYHQGWENPNFSEMMHFSFNAKKP
jgi:hypothetical protein